MTEIQIFYANVGVSALAANTASVVPVDITRSTISNNLGGFSAGAVIGNVVAAISNSLFSPNSDGISGNDSGVEITLSGNTVSNSAYGVFAANGALIHTLQNNAIRGNSIADTTGLTPVGGN